MAAVATSFGARKFEHEVASQQGQSFHFGNVANFPSTVLAQNPAGMISAKMTRIRASTQEVKHHGDQNIETEKQPRVKTVEISRFPLLYTLRDQSNFDDRRHAPGFSRLCIMLKKPLKPMIIEQKNQPGKPR